MIDVRKIQPNESVPVEATVEVAMPQGFGAVDTSVAVKGRLIGRRDSFILDAEASCRLEMTCCRCLRSVKQQLSFHITENFVETETPIGEDIGFSDKAIDILPAVQRNLFLSIPMKSLCDEDCAGLCKQCGANLNDNECKCEGEIVNEQFRDLLQMFED